MSASPTIGSPVWYYPLDEEGVHPNPGDHPLAAIITWVNEDETVNLAVFSPIGASHGKQDVTLVQDEEIEPGCCCLPHPEKKTRKRKKS